MTGDRLDELSAALTGLAAQPVDEHPPVLDAVHRGLVNELDALALSVAAERQGEGRAPARPPGGDVQGEGRAPARPAGGDVQGEGRAPARPAGGHMQAASSA